MHINTAKTFIEIIESGSFFKASEQLHVTQSTISMRISSLEENLGQKLFIRNKAGVKPTPAGLKFYKYAVQITQSWQQAQLEIGLPQGIDKYLQFVCDFNSSQQTMINVLDHFCAKNQHYATSLSFANDKDLALGVKSGQFDIAFSYHPQINNELRFCEAFQETLILVSKESRDLMYWDPDYIYVDYGKSFKDQHKLSYPIDETPKITLNSGDLALQYILKNGGSAYIRESCCQKHITAKELYRVPDAPSISLSCYLLYAKGVDEQIWFKHLLEYLNQDKN
jgi:DNA-binding transcriptional LysR family regulator